MDKNTENKRKKINARVKDVLSAYPPDNIITDPLGQYTGVPTVPDKAELDASAKIYLGSTDIAQPTQDVDDL